ncbi:MAG: translation initiation factor IF-2 N-terminal domain-containing protein [Pirellulaceae bacterium]
MPKRIYALAKELAMDSKDLVDLCTKIGIQNKGSAASSLEDDEVERIAKYIKGGDTPRRGCWAECVCGRARSAGRCWTTSRASIWSDPEFESAHSPFQTSSGTVGRTAPAAAAEEEAPTKIAAEATPQDQEPPRQPPAPVTLEPPTAQPPKRLSRDDYTPIAVGSGRVRVLDARRGSSDVKKPEGGDERRSKAPAQRREPIINLARLPKEHRRQFHLRNRAAGSATSRDSLHQR